MNPTQEQDWLLGAINGDPRALAAIYDGYSQSLYFYACRLLGDPNLAEDCVAETFSRFLKALQNGKGPREYLKAYLYRAAHNWITDFYRQRSELDWNEQMDWQTAPEHQPEHQVQLHLEQERVRRALARLTPDQRQVIALRFLEGWELEQVAAAMQKPVGAVKSIQHRALAALRRVLTTAEKEVRYETTN